MVILIGIVQRIGNGHHGAESTAETFCQSERFSSTRISTSATPSNTPGPVEHASDRDAPLELFAVAWRCSPLIAADTCSTVQGLFEGVADVEILVEKALALAEVFRPWTRHRGGRSYAWTMPIRITIPSVEGTSRVRTFQPLRKIVWRFGVTTVFGAEICFPNVYSCVESGNRPNPFHYTEAIDR